MQSEHEQTLVEMEVLGLQKFFSILVLHPTVPTIRKIMASQQKDHNSSPSSGVWLLDIVGVVLSHECHSNLLRCWMLASGCGIFN